MTDEADNADVSRVLLNRRHLLALGGAGGLVLFGAGAAVASPSGGPVPVAEAAGACALTHESIEGPYYLDYLLMRRNVVEDRTGLPLSLKLRVIDSTTCRPIRDAGVEIWHCDALGVYSGYTATGSGGGGMPPPSGTPSDPPSGPPPGGGNPGGHATPTDDLTYLRGLQITDHNGYVTFTSIVPGWYAGRAVHIHTKVHTEGTAGKSGYVGGHTCHTGQFYFEEALITRLTTVTPYATNATSRTTLDADSLYDGTGATGGLLALHYDPRHLARGVRAGLTMSVDPSATNDGETAP